MPKDIRQLYQSLKEARRDYLDAAENVAALTIPDVMPQGRIIESHPWSHVGTEAVNSLAGVSSSLIMPDGQKFLEYKFQASVVAKLVEKGLDVDGTQIADVQSELESEMIAVLEDVKLKLLLQPLMETLLIEHANVIIIDEPTEEQPLPELRCMPLRSFVVDMISGKLNFIILQEADPDNTEVRENTNIRDERHEADDFEDDSHSIYTFVDYAKGEVWQQRSNQKTATKIGRSTTQYIYISTSDTLVGSYSPGYTHRYKGTLKTANDLMRGLTNAAAIANWTVLMISAEGDPHFLEQIKNVSPLEPLVIPVGDTETGAKFLTTDAKISDWGFVAAFLDKIESSLDSPFAMGISRRKPKTRSAEEVIQITQEINTQASGVVTAVADGINRVIDGVGYVMNLGLVVVDGNPMTFKDAKIAGKNIDTTENLFRPKVITGMTAITRDTKLRSMMEGVAAAIAIDQQLAQDLAGTGPLWMKMWADNINADIDTILEFMASSKQETPSQAFSEEEQAIAMAISDGSLTPEEGAAKMKQIRAAGPQAVAAAGNATVEQAGLPAA